MFLSSVRSWRRSSAIRLRTTYLSRNHLYSPEQHGFRNKHSTATALISVNDSLMEAADRGDISILTLIDLSRAFDVVDHQTLLNQLQLLQIAPGWFRSYLAGHRQCVQVLGGEKSTLLPTRRLSYVTCAVL